MSPSYDNAEDIRTHLASLDELHTLIEQRRKADQRGERLRSFILLGRWKLVPRKQFVPALDV